MIAFPWLALGLAIVVIAWVLASTPAGSRWLRTRGADAFVYPSLRAVATVIAAIVIALVSWYVLAGPPE